MNQKQLAAPLDASISITQLNDLDKLKAYMFLRETALNTPILRDKIFQSAEKKANSQAFKQLFEADPKSSKGIINNLTGLTTKNVGKAFDTLLSNSPERNSPKWKATGIESQSVTYKQLYIKQLLKDPASAIISTLAEKTLEIRAFQEAFRNTAPAKEKAINQEKVHKTIIGNLSANIQNVYGASMDDVKKMTSNVFNSKQELQEHQSAKPQQKKTSKLER